MEWLSDSLRVGTIGLLLFTLVSNVKCQCIDTLRYSVKVGSLPFLKSEQKIRHYVNDSLQVFFNTDNEVTTSSDTFIVKDGKWKLIQGGKSYLFFSPDVFSQMGTITIPSNEEEVDLNTFYVPIEQLTWKGLSAFVFKKYYGGKKGSRTYYSTIYFNPTLGVVYEEIENSVYKRLHAIVFCE